MSREEAIEAIKEAYGNSEYTDEIIKALEQEPTSKSEALVSLDVYKQVACERDIAIQQLHELGYEFGQKIEPTTKNDLGVDCIVDVLGRYTDLDIPYKHKIAEDILNNLSSVTPQLSSELEKNSKKLEKNFGELDCISRADAIHAVSEALKRTFVEYEDIANKVIGKLPSVTPQEPKIVTIVENKYDKDKLKELINKAVLTVTPQEPFINKPCVSSGICEHDKQKVLEKIRAEIEAIIGERNLDDYDFCSGLICARKIIDKYKAEMEE